MTRPQSVVPTWAEFAASSLHEHIDRWLRVERGQIVLPLPDGGEVRIDVSRQGQKWVVGEGPHVQHVADPGELGAAVFRFWMIARDND